MAFDPTKYKVTSAKPLPVILLLDVSGSMDGEKINNLYDATIDMIDTFSDSNSREISIEVAIITFGNEVKLYNESTPYMKATELKNQGLAPFKANGLTPLGTALRMAKDIIEDKDLTPSKVYRPAVVLVSDGQPTDNWQEPLDKFINDGRSKKWQRFAIAIGTDVDKSVLEKFVGNYKNLFEAEEAKDIEKVFKTVTMSVSMRAKSQNPNSVISVINKFDENPDNDDEDDLI